MKVTGEAQRLVPAKLIDEVGSYQSSAPTGGYDRQAPGVGGFKVKCLGGERGSTDYVNRDRDRNRYRYRNRYRIRVTFGFSEAER